MDQKARGLIRLCIEDSILANMMDQNTVKGLWEKLEIIYPSKRLFNLCLHEGGSFTTHLDEFNSLINQLLVVDVILIENEKVITLLCSLPDS